ncbi:MAG: tetratricopeptide repeat protein [Gemmatimonadota bacterium]
MPLDEQLLEASRLSESGDDPGALKLLLDLEADHPSDPTLLCMLGALSAHLGAEGMSSDFFRRCLAQNPTNPQILITAGSGLARSGDTQAEAALRLAALTAPELPAARMHYGAFLVRSGLLAQGIEELSAARGLDPDSAEVRRELGIALLLAGSTNDGLSEIEAATAAEPEDPDAKLLYGLALIQEGDLPRAAEELYTLAEPLAEDAEVQILLALTFAAQGWEEEAWLALSRAEAAPIPADAAVTSAVEDAIAAGQQTIRALLLDELAPSTLRDRIYRE